MYCPYGHKKGTQVIDSRPAKDGRSVRRRRRCRECSARFTTVETLQNVRLTVIKRDGSKEDYSREKIARGVSKALEKRPQEKNLDDIVRGIEYAVIRKSQNKGEITSREIGKIILKTLADVDEVAYLRFVSVYRSFGSAQSFRKEVEKLQQ